MTRLTAQRRRELSPEERLRQCRQRASAREAALNDQLRRRAIGRAEHGVQGAEVCGILRPREPLSSMNTEAVGWLGGTETTSCERTATGGL